MCLLQGVISVSEEEFTFIYSENFDSVVNFIDKRVNNFAVSEELANDVFFNVYKYGTNYDSNRSNIRTWIYTIAKNRLKNYYRDSKIGKIIFENNVEEIQDDANAIEKFIEKEDNKSLIKELLSILSNKERKIIFLKYYIGLNSNEIGNILNMKDATVRVTLKRAIDKMKG